MNTDTAIALAVVGVVAAANWWSRWRNDDRLEMWTKPLATILVVVLALVAGGATGPVVITVAALILCLAGDVALLPRIDRFVVGLGAFLLGHLAFIAALGAIGLDAPGLAAIAFVAVAATAFVVGRRIVTAARVSEPGLVGPVIAYLTIISAMVVVAWGTGIAIAMLGATAFIVSDSVLGWRRFVGEQRWMAVVVMATYHLALVGLALTPSVAV
jgi:uncharacterized membrane protein YhhN